MTALTTPKSARTQSGVQLCIKKPSRAVEYYHKVLAPKFEEPKQSEVEEQDQLRNKEQVSTFPPIPEVLQQERCVLPAPKTTVQTRSATKAPTSYILEVEGGDSILPCVQRQLEHNRALQTLLDELFMVREQLLEDGLLFECFLAMHDYNVIFRDGTEHMFGVKALSRLFDTLVEGLCGGDGAEHPGFWPPHRHNGCASVSRKLVDVLARVGLRVKTN